MLEKLKALFNVKALFEDVLLSKVAAKATTAATTFVIALLAGPKVVPVLDTIKPFLEQAKIDPTLVASAAVAFLIGGLLNWIKRIATK